uniref:Peroxisomal assembly protein PEX3 n=1 Tax=Strongyloides papillosus TaxID=174720 RepID=A0A0N5BR15_STREA
MSILTNTFDFIKRHKKAIIASSTIVAGGAASIYYYLSKKEESLKVVDEKWENEYINKINILKKKHEYLLNAYSAARQLKMKEYVQKILKIIDDNYNIENIKTQIMDAETSDIRAKAFINLGKTAIARDISFSIITCCMLVALECQANVLAYEISHQSRFKNTSSSTDSEAYYTQTFLEMITLFISENNLKNIMTKINEIVFTDMESVDLKKSYTKDEFINNFVNLGKAVLHDDFFQSISDKFVPNMKFVRQQQIELVILFEDYVDLLDIINQNHILETLIEQYLTNFSSIAFSKIKNDNCYYVGLIPKISESYDQAVRQNSNLNVSDIITDIQNICYDKLLNKA